MTPPLLQAIGLQKHFALGPKRPFGKPLKLHAVDGVDLTIAPGEAVGLVGESGCGKSTLARLVSRLLDPTSGELLLEGREISNQTTAEFARSDRRRMIQMVFQDPTESLNPRFSVFDLIADPVRTLMPRGGSAALRARVEAAAEAVNLPLALLDRFPHQLSGGQKARVGIARALVVEPRLLVLDEPTSALDVSVQATVLQLLDRLRRERGIALLFVSHDLNVVRLLCSRIIVMYLGQVVESGPSDQIYSAPSHPYTKALLSAIPSLRPQLRERVKLEGDPQSPISPSTTRCRFCGRCPVEVAECSQHMPELRTLPDGRQARCHFAG
ncbi:ABC transporter ATP-binding protein [Frigidibacter sp.]|uniref:oligopeptide/dipeptide ABC transporter ATP-binding protein n=1 Tax=Frigidibacter sp. TaxID=2586418 RepID=UPI002736E7ED|nr:ABC transporter ATP-binding protein [Frigidibacter sp.]MDP3342440.1 ABC transporter ATP-binding protein [Frigidibacter sp.]